jgi:hypothetical protein
VTTDAAPPESKYPRLDDNTLTTLERLRFPAIAGAGGDPRRIEGPGVRMNDVFAPLPYLVPQVDADGNDLAGIRVPEVSVPLATTTGWNFRAERIGNPSTIVALLGSYLPFPKTRAERESRDDPRMSIAERYTGREDYLSRIRVAAAGLVKSGFLLEEDVEGVIRRAERHWDYATSNAHTQAR